MAADVLVRASVEAAQRVAEGRAWAQAWAQLLQEAFEADALCSIVSWAHPAGPRGSRHRVQIWAVPTTLDPPPRQAGATHPSLALLQDPACPSAHRLSDHVRMVDYWRSAPFRSVHAACAGRYPAALRLRATPRTTVFAGLVRRDRDFTSSEMRELARLDEPIASALAYRDAIAERQRGWAIETVLTTREREVLTHVSEGWTDEHIGHVLAISERTVRKHLSSARAKVGASCRAEAAAWWARHGDG